MRPAWLSHDQRDGWVVAAAGLHGALVAAALALRPHAGWGGRAALVAGLALLMAWGSNTVSHIHLHTPLFRGAAANRAFALYLTLLLGVPQRWWTRYHLRHHELADPAGGRLGVQGGLELALVAALPLLLALCAPATALLWASAIAAGYGLCALQGQGEHAGTPAGVDRRGRLYNTLWFNDGFHAAHHRAPAAHWTSLPAHGRADDVSSAWPPALRGLASAVAGLPALVPAALDALERLALRSPALQHFMLATHERALRALAADAGLAPTHLAARAPLDVVIVGGGLHPRTALLFARLWPHARLTLLDRDPAHLATAARVLAAQPRPIQVRLVCATFDPAAPPPCDVLVVPLAFRGDRSAIFARPPAPVVLVHDWLWRRGGHTCTRVSWLLCKRLVLVRADAARARAARNGGNVPAVTATLRPWPWPPLLPLPPCSPPISSTGSVAVTRPPS